MSRTSYNPDEESQYFVQPGHLTRCYLIFVHNAAAAAVNDAVVTVRLTLFHMVSIHSVEINAEINSLLLNIKLNVVLLMLVRSTSPNCTLHALHACLSSNTQNAGTRSFKMHPERIMLC